MNFVQENVLSNSHEEMYLNQQAFMKCPHIGVDLFILQALLLLT